MRATLTAACAALIALAGAARTGPAAGTGATPFKAYLHVASGALDSAAARKVVAERYGLVIVRGAFRYARELRAASPSIKVYKYNRVAFTRDEASRLLDSHPGFLARDCARDLIHARSNPDAVLADLTNDSFRTWFAEGIDSESQEADGQYVDLLGSFFSTDHWTARPCRGGTPVTDTQWRRANIDFVRILRAVTDKPVIGNGYGIGSGEGYFARQDESDELIAALTGVQIEVFTRQLHTPLDEYKTVDSWLKDVRYLQALHAKGKTAFAYTKVSPDLDATNEQLVRLRDYALGTFLLGFGPGAYFQFNDEEPTSIPTLESKPLWSRTLGQPTSSFSGTSVRHRPFRSGEVAVNPTAERRTYKGRTLAPHSVLRL